MIRCCLILSIVLLAACAGPKIDATSDLKDAVQPVVEEPEVLASPVVSDQACEGQDDGIGGTGCSAD